MEHLGKSSTAIKDSISSDGSISPLELSAHEKDALSTEINKLTLHSPECLQSSSHPKKGNSKLSQRLVPQNPRDLPFEVANGREP